MELSLFTNAWPLHLPTGEEIIDCQLFASPHSSNIWAGCSLLASSTSRSNLATPDVCSLLLACQYSSFEILDEFDEYRVGYLLSRPRNRRLSFSVFGN